MTIISWTLSSWDAENKYENLVMTNALCHGNWFHINQSMKNVHLILPINIKNMESILSYFIPLFKQFSWIKWTIKMFFSKLSIYRFKKYLIFDITCILKFLLFAMNMMHMSPKKRGRLKKVLRFSNLISFNF